MRCYRGVNPRLRFRPPRITLETPSGEEPALPHIRLDRAIEFLLGDRLA